MDRSTNRFQAGLLAAVLAATLQFVLWAGVLSGAVAQPAKAHAGALNAIHCTTGEAPNHEHAPGNACLLCPICLALSLPGTLPAPPPSPAPPVLAGSAPALPALSPAPAPLLVLAAAYPRGPPRA
jgi:hypothetical protein